MTTRVSLVSAVLFAFFLSGCPENKTESEPAAKATESAEKAGAAKEGEKAKDEEAKGEEGGW